MTVLSDEPALVRSRVVLLGPRSAWADASEPVEIVPALVDAVWSIANRRAVIANVMARSADLRERAGDVAGPETPMALAMRIRSLGGAEAFAELVANRQRTSARGGVLRTEALRRLADVLADARIDGRRELVSAPPDRIDTVRAGWTSVPGHRSGISWELFLLLLDAPRGPSNTMTRRFVARALGRADTGGVTGDEAATLVATVARDLGCAPRDLELAAWRYEMEGGDGLAEARRRTARTGAGAGGGSAGHAVGQRPAPVSEVGGAAVSREARNGIASAGASATAHVDVPAERRPTRTAGPVPRSEAMRGTAAVTPVPESRSLDRGVAGASARREHARRTARVEARTRERHPVLGGLLARTPDEPANVRSWSKGAEGEEAVGRRLDRLQRSGLIVLHDRRIPGTRRNIDHVVVGPSGVWVVDTKKYAGRAQVTTSKTGRTRLTIDGNDQSRLIEKLAGQVALVTAAVARLDVGVPVHGALCMVGTELPLLRTLEFGGFSLLRPRAVAQRIDAPGPVAERRATSLAAALAAEFPAA